MTTFIARGAHRPRVLLDGGGEKVVNGVKRKTPAKWADFARDGKVVLTNKKHIEVLKGASGYGIDFVIVPEAPKGGVLIGKEVEKHIKAGATPVLLGKGGSRQLSRQELELMAEK